MGYIVNGKLIKYGDTYLFQRKCYECNENYLFGIEEAKVRAGTCFVCASCTPKIPPNAEWVDGSFGVILNGWENRIAQNYKKVRSSKKNFKRTLQEDNFICQYCYEEGNTVDHIIPVVYGGTNKRENLVCACTTCNSFASSFIFNDFASKQIYLHNKKKIWRQQNGLARLNTPNGKELV